MSEVYIAITSALCEAIHCQESIHCYLFCAKTSMSRKSTLLSLLYCPQISKIRKSTTLSFLYCARASNVRKIYNCYQFWVYCEKTFNDRKVCFAVILYCAKNTMSEKYILLSLCFCEEIQCWDSLNCCHFCVRTSTVGIVYCYLYCVKTSNESTIFIAFTLTLHDIALTWIYTLCHLYKILHNLCSSPNPFRPHPHHGLHCLHCSHFYIVHRHPKSGKSTILSFSCCARASNV